MTWDNVDFPVTGDYTFKAEADDVLFIDINGQRIGTVRGGSFENLVLGYKKERRKSN